VRQPQQGVAIILGNITGLEGDHLLNEDVKLPTMSAVTTPIPDISGGFGKQMRSLGSRVAPETTIKGQETKKIVAYTHGQQSDDGTDARQPQRPLGQENKRPQRPSARFLEQVQIGQFAW